MVLAEEIKLLTGKAMRVTQDRPESGDILLSIDPRLEGQAYALEVDKVTVVRGGDYAAVAMGTVTLLHAISDNAGEVTVPLLDIDDEPVSNYRGLMIDLAGKWHSPAILKQIIVLCRWYKINYLQMHLTDNQAFTFPSKAFPKLATERHSYTLEQLRQLEEFARVRGVTLIPELDVPGHSLAMIKAMPELWGTNPLGGNAICPAREQVYQALDTIVGEMCEVFASTPYFHIGADEVNTSHWKQCKDCQSYMSKHQIDSVDELYRHFIVRMNAIVKKHRKKMIVWEGFRDEGTIQIPRDIKVMVFECKYNLPQNLIAAGYRVINTSWKPLYVVQEPAGTFKSWSPQYIYGWNLHRWENWWDQSLAYPNGINVKPTDQVMGAQMCSWALADNREVPFLRRRLAAMSERVWSGSRDGDFQDFSARLVITDGKLDKLLAPYSKGPTAPKH